MKTILSVDNMRKSDAFTIANKIPSKELMKRAGIGSYNEICKFCDIQTEKKNIENMNLPAFGIFCGSGNNAGDGYVIANELYKIGANVDLILMKEKFSEDGKYYFDICNNNKIKWHIYNDKHKLNQYDYIIDCLLGTGFKGEVHGPISTAIKNINKSNTKVFSIDINSGLNGDDGISELAVKSNLTISIGGYKTGHFLGDASSYIDKLVNIDIGIEPVDKPYLLIEDCDDKNLNDEQINNYIIVKNLKELESQVQNQYQKPIKSY